MSSEALHEMSVAQVEEFSKMAQHLLIANLPNADYEALLLYHKEDMEAQQEKISISGMPGSMATRSPTLKPSTPGPTSTTVPADV